MALMLPDFVEPMLARLGPAFDSDRHLFEVKWDGARSLGFIEGGAYRLRSRNKRDQTPLYPELACLAALPDGCLLDGELVVLQDGKPSFEGMLSRENAGGPRRAAEKARTRPATYVVFDVLYVAGTSCRAEPLTHRRELLAELLAVLDTPHVVMSDGLVGGGLAFFEQVAAQGLEGMVAKRLDAPYESGKRTGAWTKCKTTQRAHCVVLGYVPDGARDLKSLIIGTEREGVLRWCGRVGSGLTQAVGRELRARLAAVERDAPLVPAVDPEAVWVEPEVFCKVEFLEFTSNGTLRAPVFHGLVHEP